MRLSISILALLAFGACRTTTTASEPTGTNAVISTTRPTQAWQLAEGSSTLGFVVRFEDPGDEQQTFFSVRNALQQDLGLIDRYGRFFRYRPHRREPEWLGSGTILEGARRILDAGPESELVEVRLADLAAGAASLAPE